MSSKKLAILGGTPTFDTKLGIIKPQLNMQANEISKNITQILQSNMVSGVNIYTKKLEHEIETFLEVKHVVAMSSCTNAMILTIQALGLMNSEIIIPSLSFSATAHMLYWTNCKPIFADVDIKTANITVETIKDVITPNTKAILGVHLYGNPCDINRLDEYAKEKNIHLLFDGAHALGSEYRGKPVSSYGHPTAYSASPTKLFSTVEGGFVSSNNSELIETLKISRNYGNYPDYSCKMPGLNARMSEIHAAVGLNQINFIPEYVENRNLYANYLQQELSNIPGLKFQHIDSKDKSSFKDFSIFIDEDKFGLSRDEVAIALNKEGIQTKFYFYPPIHHLSPYKKYTTDENLPNTMTLTNSVLSLPIYSQMDQNSLSGIAEAVTEIHRNASGVKNSIKNEK